MAARHHAASPSRSAWRTVLVWAVLCILALWQAGHLRERLQGEMGGVPGSMSETALASLTRDFDFPYAHLLLVTLEASPAAVADLDEIHSRLAARLAAARPVRALRDVPSAHPDLRAIAVGLNAGSLGEAEQAVPVVRGVVADVVPSSGGFRGLVTGQAALNSDAVRLGSEQATEAELRVMPVVLGALLVAFGALGAAAAPLVTGAAAVLLAMGVLSVVAQWLHLSILALNVATMVGLSLGIDYALFVVSRIREEGGDVSRAARRTTPVILASVGTVMIGFGALAFVPVPETVGMGLGGLIVAATSLLAAVTLLPAIATLLGPWLDAPRFLSNRLSGESRVRRWEARARLVVRRPWLGLSIAVAILGTCLAPLKDFDLGFPGFSAAPRHLESVLALDAVQRLGIGGAMLPAQIIVRTPDDSPILAASRLQGLAGIAAWLEARPEVAQVHAIAGDPAAVQRLRAGAALLGTAALPGHLPAEGRALLSKDRAATLIQVVPSATLSYAEARAFTRVLREQDWRRFPGLHDASVAVGGPTSVEADFIDLSRRMIPWLALFVMAATFVSLFLLTRSIVLPLKAVLTNLLTVAAAIGAATWLFRSDFGARLLDLPEPVTTVQALFPVMVFCLLFGLSMDYETFLISRVQEAHEQGHDDRTAVIRGLGASGGIITSTAVIMAVVFAGFAFCDLVPVKLLGVTLAIGIVLDATVTRLLLVPSAIVLLGRWNWYPGRRVQTIAASKAASASYTAAPPV